jgi:hypothetical protein
MTSITIQAAAATAVANSTPRGARWAVNLLLPLFSGLHRRSERRAASRIDIAQVRRVKEAARLRRQAASQAGDDSRLLADLLAACDRHELGD